MVDAVVVGSGPNGLVAASILARAGLSVELFEAVPTAGGGCRTEQLTLPGFVHDVCSTVHPLLAASPFFRELALPGVRLLSPEVAYAHPLDGARAAAIVRSVDDTAAGLGRDRRRYGALMAPLVHDWRAVIDGALAPQRSFPRAPVAIARFGLRSVWPARALASMFATDEARAVLAGACAHSMQPLGAPLTAAFGIVLGLLAHAVGWPVVEGGSERIADALVKEIEAAGGRVYTNAPITALAELPAARATLLDVSPRGLIALAGDRLPARVRAAMTRFNTGRGSSSSTGHWTVRSRGAPSACRRTATVHVGGTLEEVARCESEVARGRVPERPFCIVAQPSVVDRHARPRVSTRCGATATCRRGRPVDMTRGDRGADRAVRAWLP